jgi:hypothetical protein
VALGARENPARAPLGADQRLQPQHSSRRADPTLSRAQTPNPNRENASISACLNCLTLSHFHFSNRELPGSPERGPRNAPGFGVAARPSALGWGFDEVRFSDSGEVHRTQDARDSRPAGPELLRSEGASRAKDSSGSPHAPRAGVLRGGTLNRPSTNVRSLFVSDMHFQGRNVPSPSVARFSLTYFLRYRGRRVPAVGMLGWKAGTSRHVCLHSLGCYPEHSFE